MEHDLTRGNVLKTIAVFALPYMLSYFLQMLYGMADLYMMGQFSGAAGITAVGNGAQTLYIITVTLVGLAMGTTVIVGHAVGSRRFDRAETAIGNTITLFMGVSVVLAVVLLALCPQIVALIGTPGRGSRRNRRLPAYLLYRHSLYRRVQHPLGHLSRAGRFALAYVRDRRGVHH